MNHDLSHFLISECGGMLMTCNSFCDNPVKDRISELKEFQNANKGPEMKFM